MTYEEAVASIRMLRDSEAGSGRASDLFELENGNALAAILGNVEQTFGGEPLYATVQLRAAHLLYFVIKDHAFLDGTKRIASMLFSNYLRAEGLSTEGIDLEQLGEEVEASESTPAERHQIINHIVARIPIAR